MRTWLARSSSTSAASPLCPPPAAATAASSSSRCSCAASWLATCWWPPSSSWPISTSWLLNCAVSSSSRRLSRSWSWSCRASSPSTRSARLRTRSCTSVSEVPGDGGASVGSGTVSGGSTASAAVDCSATVAVSDASWRWRSAMVSVVRRRKLMGGQGCHAGDPAIPYSLQLAAGWSSQVARRAHNPKVVGSNPTPATNLDVKAQVRDLGLRRGTDARQVAAAHDAVEQLVARVRRQLADHDPPDEQQLVNGSTSPMLIAGDRSWRCARRSRVAGRCAMARRCGGLRYCVNCAAMLRR